LIEGFTNLWVIWASDKKTWKEIVEKYCPLLAKAFLEAIKTL